MRAALSSVIAAALISGCVALDATDTREPSGSVGTSAAPSLGVSLALPSVASTLATAAASFTPTASPTVAMTASPTAVLSASPSATAAITVVPTVEITLPPPASPSPASPSVEPTLEVTPEPEETPAPAGPDELVNDLLNDNAGGWGIGQTSGGVVDFVDGALQFDVESSGAWIWSRRDTGSDTAALKVIGTFVPQGEAEFGVFCAQGEDALYGVTIDTNGGWAFVSIGTDGVEFLDSNPDAGLEVPVGEPIVVGLDCSGTSTGALRMVLFLTNTGPVAIYEQPDGPDSFDRLGAYVESLDDAVLVRLESILGFGSGDPNGDLDADAADLMTHVPDGWQEGCWDTPLPPMFGDGASAQLTCFIGGVSTGGEVAEYVQFATTEDMDAAYDIHVERFPVASPVDSCED
ncbi:MAG: hypothetical protein ABIP53_06960, partial [Candidatus Limnocylindrales bacterium]